jgi:hypothetical protein
MQIYPEFPILTYGKSSFFLSKFIYTKKNISVYVDQGEDGETSSHEAGISLYSYYTLLLLLLLLVVVVTIISVFDLYFEKGRERYGRRRS